MSIARAPLVALFVLSTLNGASAEPPPGRTLGFVIRDTFTAVYETKFMDECPLGLNISNDEYWWRGLPSEEERARLTENGLINTLNRWGTASPPRPGQRECLPQSAPHQGPAVPHGRRQHVIRHQSRWRCHGAGDRQNVCPQKFHRCLGRVRRGQSDVSSGWLHLRLPG